MVHAKTRGARRQERDQLNLVFAADSPLARRLRAAEQATGQPRTQIARDILDAFLGIWLRAELAKQQVLDAARAASKLPTGETVRLTPRYAGPDRPAPGYAEVVDARRRIAPRIVGEEVMLEDSGTVRHVPRRRSSVTLASLESADDVDN